MLFLPQTPETQSLLMPGVLSSSTGNILCRRVRSYPPFSSGATKAVYPHSSLHFPVHPVKVRDSPSLPARSPSPPLLSLSPVGVLDFIYPWLVLTCPRLRASSVAGELSSTGYSCRRWRHQPSAWVLLVQLLPLCSRQSCLPPPPPPHIQWRVKTWAGWEFFLSLLCLRTLLTMVFFSNPNLISKSPARGVSQPAPPSFESTC